MGHAAHCEPAMTRHPLAHNHSIICARGFTLIELMISLTLGLMLMAGLVSVFVNSSQANREFHRSSEQIENGRYAMDVLMNDLHHAGFYGMFFQIPAAGAFPDPCALNDAMNQISSGI